jgi:endonuclease G
MFMRFIAISGMILLLVGCSQDSIIEPNIEPPTSDHLLLGRPLDSDSTDDYLILRYQYAVSYNPTLNVPNWVAWKLSKDWYGDVSRYAGSFISDTSLPAGMYRVKHSDYTNSGYDRGHMVRSEERTATPDDNKSTFLLTNILPQRPDLNQGVWLRLEYWCETMCKDSLKELYVVAGGIFHEPHERLNGVVAVPDSCFKIVVVLERGQGLQHVTEYTYVVAVVMPNIDGVRRDDWNQYRRSVEHIEVLTGYDFLHLIADDTETILEW